MRMVTNCTAVVSKYSPRFSAAGIDSSVSLMAAVLGKSCARSSGRTTRKRCTKMLGTQCKRSMRSLYPSFRLRPIAATCWPNIGMLYQMSSPSSTPTTLKIMTMPTGRAMPFVSNQLTPGRTAVLKITAASSSGTTYWNRISSQNAPTTAVAPNVQATSFLVGM